MNYFERRVSGETKYQGVVVSVHLDQIELFDGSAGRREIIDHPGGVCIVPVDRDGNVTAVRQFRYAFGEELLEVPAGKLEKGEEPYECAMRELSEETGLQAGKLIPLGIVYPSPGFCTETLHVYMATDCAQGQAHLDKGEFLDVLKVPMSELMEKIMSGEIKDAKTIIGVMKADRILNARK